MSYINGTMMQFFHWYTPEGGKLWEEVKDKAGDLAGAGFTALWLPPAYKGTGGGHDVGYGCYDLFDLGEFDQKGTVSTKYGTRDEFVAAVKVVQESGMQVYADVVFNHKDGADHTEWVLAQQVDWNDRNRSRDGLVWIEIYSHFTFPGRGGKYSSMKWNWWHFDSVRYNAYTKDDSKLYRLKDKQFETVVDPRYGNYDYLLGCDLDTNVEQVRGELEYWGRWFLDTTSVDGFRLDAVKHIRFSFFKEWLDHVRTHARRNLFSVGEYWSGNVEDLQWYIRESGGRMSLFDVPLHYNFYNASRAGGLYDMRQILDGTLVQQQPMLAVTFVDNHDSQPLQMLESVVETWFKPLAYALILLRLEGYPCVFYADYYGAHYWDKGRDGRGWYEIWLDSHRYLIDKFLYARKHYAYGEQYNYFDHPDIIGWTRIGDGAHPLAMAVLMSDGPGGSKWMEVARKNATFRDLTEHVSAPVHSNADGWGEFRCNGGSVSVWIEE